LPDEGVHEIYARGVDTVIAGTAVAGGRAGGAGRGGLPRQWALALRQWLSGECLAAGELLEARRWPAAPPPGRHLALLAWRLPVCGRAGRGGELGRDRAARHRELRP
jgi:hypothetical protein